MTAIIVLLCILFSLYASAVAISTAKAFHQEDILDDIDIENTFQEPFEGFRRTEDEDWDFVQYSERPFVKNKQPNKPIKLEINETDNRTDRQAS